MKPKLDGEDLFKTLSNGSKTDRIGIDFADRAKKIRSVI